MPGDDRLNELLLSWEEGQLRGQPLAPEELCQDCPDLLEGLKRNIEALRALEPMLDTADGGHIPDVGPVGLRLDTTKANHEAAPAADGTTGTKGGDGEPAGGAGPQPAVPGYEIE